MIKVIAVDDEPLALRQLESYIAKVPFLELVASCRSALEARAVLEERAVDAMFLDINMPDLSGVDFVRTLAAAPLVVFTTAYSEYAVEGFKVDAVDYLLKPFSLSDFIKSCDRLRTRFEALHAQSSIESGVSDDALFFKTDYKTVRVRLEDILYVESMSEYVKIYTLGKGAPLLVLLSLKLLCEKLPESRFMRIHRSYIISLAHLKEVGKGEVVLEDGTKLPVGELYRQELKDYLRDRSLG